MNTPLTQITSRAPQTFLDFPFADNLDELDADFAILGIPFGMPYSVESMANDQSNAPDAIRQFANYLDISYTRSHYDFDLGGTLLDGKDIKVVDCGNVTADSNDHREHYRRAEVVARNGNCSKENYARTYRRPS